MCTRKQSFDQHELIVFVIVVPSFFFLPSSLCVVQCAKVSHNPAITLFWFCYGWNCCKQCSFLLILFFYYSICTHSTMLFYSSKFIHVKMVCLDSTYVQFQVVFLFTETEWNKRRVNEKSNVRKQKRGLEICVRPVIESVSLSLFN